MAQDANKMERYSSIVDDKLRATSVFASIFNNRHDGNPAAGAVKIPTRAEATVSAYDTANGVSLSNPQTAYIPMICDKDYAVNELIDGFMAAAVPDGMVAERLDSAGYALANNVDELLAALLVADGTASADTTTLTKSNIYEKIVDDITTAKEAKVDASKLWIAVTSVTQAKLTKSPEFVGAAANVAELGAGYRGMINGVPVYEAINLNGRQKATNTVDYVVGNGSFCHFVEAWNVGVSVEDLKDGKHIGCSAVQGRKAIGCTISQPSTVIVHTA